ncbi:MAG: hypothetical protein HY906_07220 [Deltaproteobacteria bacterium]|nr:hypothetical protein [Deltaproteobacteria bacterium]
MAVTHRSWPRALAALVLCLALLAASVARAEDPAPKRGSGISRYVVTPLLATVVLVVVVALAQAARAPARDVRPPATALHAIDRALAAARGREAAYSNRWWAPRHEARTLAVVAAPDRGR